MILLYLLKSRDNKKNRSDFARQIIIRVSLALLTVISSSCSEFNYSNEFSKLPDVAVVQFVKQPSGILGNLQSAVTGAKYLQLSSFSLPPQPLVTSSTQTLYLLNAGQLDATQLTLSVDSNQYTVNSQCGTTLSAQSNLNVCKVNLTLYPLNLGNIRGNLKVSYVNGRNKSVTTSLPLLGVSEPWAFLSFDPNPGTAEVSATAGIPKSFPVHVNYNGDQLPPNQRGLIPPAQLEDGLASDVGISFLTAAFILPGHAALTPSNPNVFSLGSGASYGNLPPCGNTIGTGCFISVSFQPSFDTSISPSTIAQANFNGAVSLTYNDGVSSGHFVTTGIQATGLNQTQLGQFNANVIYNWNSSSSGTSTPPTVTYDPSSGGTPIDIHISTSGPNTSTVPGENVTIALPGAPFQLDPAHQPTCGPTLPIGGCDIYLIFDPTAAENLVLNGTSPTVGQVNVAYNYASYNQLSPTLLPVTILGYVVKPAQLIVTSDAGGMNPTSSVNIGTVNSFADANTDLGLALQTYYLYNTGGVTATNITFNSPPSPGFTLTPTSATCLQSGIAPNGYCEIQVDYQAPYIDPTGPVTVSESTKVTYTYATGSKDSATPTTITLNATATSATYIKVANSKSLTFPNGMTGVDATTLLKFATMTVFGTAGYSGLSATITSTATGFFSTPTGCPSSIPISDTATNAYTCTFQATATIPTYVPTGSDASVTGTFNLSASNSTGTLTLYNSTNQTYTAPTLYAYYGPPPRLTAIISGTNNSSTPTPVGSPLPLSLIFANTSTLFTATITSWSLGTDVITPGGNLSANEFSLPSTYCTVAAYSQTATTSNCGTLTYVPSTLAATAAGSKSLWQSTSSIPSSSVAFGYSGASANASNGSPVSGGNGSGTGTLSSATSLSAYGTSQVTLVPSPTSITIPQTYVGQSDQSQTVTIAAYGVSSGNWYSGATLSSTGGSSGVSSSEITVSQPNAGCSAAPSNCTLTFVYSPKTSENFSSTATSETIKSTSGSSTQIGLSGTAVYPSVSSSSSTGFSFSQTYVGQSTQSNSITFTPSGESIPWFVSASISGITGNAATTVTVSSSNCSSTTTASSTCAIILQYLPTTAQTTSWTNAQAIITYYQTATQTTTLSVPITGGIAQPPTISLSTVNFGTIYAGQSPAPQATVTVTPEGQSNAGWATSFSLGSGASQYLSIASTTCAATTGNTTACAFTLQYSAPASLATTDKLTSPLTINYTNVSGTTGLTSSLMIQGTLSPASPMINAAASGLNFGKTLIQGSNPAMNPGLFSQIQNVTITNTSPSSSGGGAAVTLGALNLSPADSSFTVLNDACNGQTIASGGSCTIQVKFAATSLGSKTETLNYSYTNQSNSAKGSVSAVLIGEGTAPIQVYAGGNTTCIVNELQGISCWGDNTSGQFGIGNTNPSSTISSLAAPEGIAVTQLAVGKEHVCALFNFNGTSSSQNGQVTCWGSNQFGQLGNGSTSQASVTSPSWTPVTLAGQASQISAGGSHTCALLTGGGIQCWGNNSNGQLGNGSTANLYSPASVSGLGGPAIQVSAGVSHTCAVLQGNTAQCWGGNLYGELGLGQANSATYFSNPNSLYSNPNNISMISTFTGNGSTCALNTLGQVKCVGQTYEQGPGGIFYGILGFCAYHDSSGNVISCGSSGVPGDASSGLNLSTDGIFGTTPQDMTYLSSIPFQGPVTSLATGGYHACALFSGSNVGCWGLNDYGQLGASFGSNVGALTSDFSNFQYAMTATQGVIPLSIATGTKHSCVVSSDNKVRCWGTGTSVNANGHGSDTSASNNNGMTPIYDGTCSSANSTCIGGTQPGP